MAARSARTLTREVSRDSSRAYGDPRAENRLVHADNLIAMRALAREFAGRFRCAYLDPPYNTGRAFAEYGDARSSEEWIAMMEPRLEALRALVAEDGAVFAEIDDTMLGALLAIMDRVFGAANRASIVTIVRSAGTGHKAKNAGPVNVADYLLVYARERSKWKPTPLVRARRGYDFAYATYVPNVESDHDEWTFESLAMHAATSLGFAGARAGVKDLGRVSFNEKMARFAIERAERTVRFAQPRYEAVSREARAWIDLSKANPKRVYRFDRPGHKEMILRGGNRVLFLKDKVKDGVLVEPLTNVWDDVPFQGIAREGGVAFVRNKKPEKLVERVLAMATREGDWVIDPFLGSGTTAAVAHKMGRRWVGIEEGVAMESMAVPRLKRVVDGDDATGVTKAHAWKGGGGFAVWT